MRRHSTAERIIYEFRHNVTEVHRKALETTLGIRPEEFDAAMPNAKDLAKEADDVALTPVYRVGDRERFVSSGWWTCRPRERLLAIADYEAQRRQLGERMRLARVQAGSKLAEFSQYAAAGLEGTLAAYLNHHSGLLDISESADWIVGAIDEALPKLFVMRNGSVS